MNNVYTRSIIKTLCYADIFNYPLTFGQIYKYYIGPKASEEKIYKNLLELIEENVVGRTGNFIYLCGRKNFSALRKRREKESAIKWEQARRVSKILARVPTIKLVGVSGSLSMENAKANDDIDLFVVTKANSLWMTRFLTQALLAFLKVRRTRDDLKTSNKICTNMYMTEDNMKVDENLFAAHEVAQLKPVINKDETYEHFLAENSWVKRYMPNALGKIAAAKRVRKSNLLSIVDKPFYLLQLMYMKKRKTREKVGPNIAMFHPRDLTKMVQILHNERYQFYMKIVRGKGQFQPQNRPKLRTKVTPGY